MIAVAARAVTAKTKIINPQREIVRQSAKVRFSTLVAPASVRPAVRVRRLCHTDPSLAKRSRIASRLVRRIAMDPLKDLRQTV